VTLYGWQKHAIHTKFLRWDLLNVLPIGVHESAKSLKSFSNYFIIAMGIEYKLSFSFSDIRKIQRLLTLISSFSRFEHNVEMYEFRSSDSFGEMPNVFVKIEPDGLYLCNNGGGKVTTQAME
jgi:hypothetical protein